MNVALVLLPSWGRESPSLAVAYLASHLEKAGHTVSRFEFNLKIKSRKWSDYLENMNYDKTIRGQIFSNSIDLSDSCYDDLNMYIEYCASSILKSKPEFIGFSVYHCNTFLSFLVAHKIRQINSQILIAFGGPDTSIKNHRSLFLKTKLVDYVMLGEGERSFPLLLEQIRTDSVSLDSKWTPEQNIDCFEYPLFRESDIKESRLPFLLPIISNRGCVGNCDFCYEKRIWGNFRQRSAENVIDEIKHQIKKHNIKIFYFNDSAVNSDANFIHIFSRKLISDNIGIQWGGNAKIKNDLTLQNLKTMYDGGCRILHFGVESGSNDVLSAMNKGINTELISNVLKNSHNNNIWIHIFLIVGHPAETEDDFVKTIKFIVKNKQYVDSIYVSRFTTYQKTIQSSKRRMINRRLRDFQSIFDYKEGLPNSLYFEKMPIDYKTASKKEFNSKITINKNEYERVTGEEYKFD